MAVDNSNQEPMPVDNLFIGAPCPLLVNAFPQVKAPYRFGSEDADAAAFDGADRGYTLSSLLALRSHLTGL
ncbi:hypothetical protein ACFRAM_28725 [Paenibacillus sp. NPDC056722]|uniref:hypothetical protein n=1 Tax=Paenibacillus sp. NPDC056722 TaxID=3345924 RepID=UPI0036B4E2C5